MVAETDLSREFDRAASFPVKIEYESLVYIMDSLGQLVCPGLPCPELIPPVTADSYSELREHLLSTHKPLHFNVDMRILSDMDFLERLKLRDLSIDELLRLPDYPRNYVVALLDRLNLLVNRTKEEAPDHIQYLVARLDVPLKLAKEFYNQKRKFALYEHHILHR